MAAGGKPACRVEGCRASIWPPLSSERICIDHFIEHSTAQLAGALQDCQTGKRVLRATLDQLAQKAEFAVIFLASRDRAESSPRSEQMLEIILGVANLQEFLSRNASLLGTHR